VRAGAVANGICCGACEERGGTERIYELVPVSPRYQLRLLRKRSFDAARTSSAQGIRYDVAANTR
jgi:hypothetical protein